jgi:hypothetical protein
LSSICTLIDLELEKLFLESPKCKDKLQISLLDNLAHLSEEVDVYGQRYGCITVYTFNCAMTIAVFTHLFLPSFIIFLMSHYLNSKEIRK